MAAKNKAKSPVPATKTRIKPLIINDLSMAFFVFVTFGVTFRIFSLLNYFLFHPFLLGISLFLILFYQLIVSYIFRVYFFSKNKNHHKNSSLIFRRIYILCLKFRVIIELSDTILFMLLPIFNEKA